MTDPTIYYPWTRQITGQPFYHHCYVVRDHRVVEYACGRGKHRGHAAATRCAEKAARRLNAVKGNREA